MTKAELVASFRALAEWHETKADKARRFPGGAAVEAMEKAAQVHEDAAQRLREILTGGGANVPIRPESSTETPPKTTNQTDEFEYHVMDVAEPVFGSQMGKQELRTHAVAKCEGTFCCIHNPSDHALKDAPLNWRADQGLMERICKHGIGHPDPDAVAYRLSVGLSLSSAHGCDGCCG